MRRMCISIQRRRQKASDGKTKINNYAYCIRVPVYKTFAETKI